MADKDLAWKAYKEADKRASTLREQLDWMSSPGFKALQTLEHLGGKQKGDTAKAAHDQLFIMKESEAEDQERRAEDAAKRFRESSKQYAKGGKVTASSRADGIAQRGKTRGTIVMCGGGYAKKGK